MIFCIFRQGNGKQEKPVAGSRMQTQEGFFGVMPVIERITFRYKNYITFELQDGRMILVPLRAFPSIEQLSKTQRKKWYISDDQLFSFDDCNEVFHIEQVLGREQEYKYGAIPKDLAERHYVDPIVFKEGFYKDKEDYFRQYADELKALKEWQQTHGDYKKHNPNKGTDEP